MLIRRWLDQLLGTEHGMLLEERYDLCMCLDDQMVKDGVTVHLSTDLRMAVVGLPAYVSERPQSQT